MTKYCQWRGVVIREFHLQSLIFSSSVNRSVSMHNKYIVQRALTKYLPIQGMLEQNLIMHSFAWRLLQWFSAAKLLEIICHGIRNSILILIYQGKSCYDIGSYTEKNCFWKLRHTVSILSMSQIQNSSETEILKFEYLMYTLLNILAC